MMEDKKLDFNQPLLSVRRYAPPTTVERRTDNSRPVIPRLPAYRSELKSGPVSNPGAVPFLWEQTPGQPKQKTKPQSQKSNTQPPIAPKLPPGRYPNANNQDSHKNDERETIEERESSDSGGSSSDDGAYVDALDTLSRAESSFLNCSMTGLDDVHVERSKSFLESQEFMMDRFLPAAKAMAIETPQYTVPKKQSLVEEGQKQIKKVSNHQCKPSLRYGPSFAKRYSHYNENENEEEEDQESDDEYNGHENLPGVCGLLPRFCFLNPVPAMSVRTRARMVSSGNKGQPRSPSVGSYSETENESRSDRTEVKSVDKIHNTELYDKTKSRNESDQTEILAVPEEKMQAGIKTFQEFLSDQGNPVIEKTLYVDTVHNVELQKSMPFSPNTQDTKDGEIFTKDMDQMHATDSSLEDFKKLNTVTNAPKFDDFNILKSEKIGENQEFKVQVTENEGKELSLLPLPPPLPKSPSDSWLWRTLPSVSTKNAAVKGTSKGPKNEIKWETMVKTTRVQRCHFHYSEETLTTIPEA